MTGEQEPRAFRLLNEAPFHFDRLDYPVSVEHDGKFPYIEVPRGRDQVSALEWLLKRFDRHYVVGVFGNTDSPTAPLQTLHKKILALNFGGFGEPQRTGKDIFNLSINPQPDSLACHLHLDAESLYVLEEEKFLDRAIIIPPTSYQHPVNLVSDCLKFLKPVDNKKTKRSVIYVPNNPIFASEEIQQIQEDLRYKGQMPIFKTNVLRLNNAKELLRNYRIYIRPQVADYLNMPRSIGVFTLE
jgi:hypothetical protein